MYAVVFFILLWVLFQLILCEPLIVDTRIHLLETNEKIHRDMNKQFMSMAKTLDIKHNISVLNSPSNLIKIMRDTQKLRFVVDLYMNDIENYDKIKKQKFKWTEPITDRVCKINLNDTEEKKWQPCNHYDEKRRYVKMVSNEVQNLPYLYDLILKFKFQESISQPQYIVLICTKKNKDRDFQKMPIVLKYSTCNEPLTSNTIAIIAPNPEWIEETSKPVIFYEEFFRIPNAAEFYENSMLRVRSWKYMAITFLNYMLWRRWERVAILSDDAVESEAFETELRSLFNTNDISYTVKSVGEVNGVKCCDFSKVLKSLKRSHPRIIIANIAEKNAQKLAEQAELQDLTFKHNIIWLARSWSEDTAKLAAKRLNTVLSVIPEITPIEAHISSVMRVINSNINNISHIILEKQFTKDIKKALIWTDESKFNVTQTTGVHHQVVASFKEGGLVFNIKRDRNTRDRDGQCTLKSKNYHKYCDDYDLIYFMLVIVGFAVTMLGITHYFQIPYRPYNRMAS